MSVLVKCMVDGSFKSFVKGSPEKIREMCLPETVPKNYDEVLQIYTECGYRVIALASKTMEKVNYLKA